MENLKALTEAVCCVAREAGHFLKEERKSFRREVVQEKHAHDYVSYVDKASEKKVVSALRKLLPEAGFIAEEGSAAYSDETYCWVVDPLDGTTNYIHDNAPYCVSIALRDKQSLLLGVVYEPCRDECFYAWKGGGAYVNGERLRVSLVSELKDAFVVTELPYNFEQYARTGEHLIHELYGKVAYRTDTAPYHVLSGVLHPDRNSSGNHVRIQALYSLGLHFLCVFLYRSSHPKLLCRTGICISPFCSIEDLPKWRYVRYIRCQNPSDAVTSPIPSNAGPFHPAGRKSDPSDPRRYA